ncbi:hypothetical protein Salat_1415300 [Sesamum alatum]|uniref:Uncharacterized protein n=1 Tax=Sesamum alatum TaxID=300844 RepID=A0AAE2CLE3_9LAMI|nr:hypothetical protein Salat_1415300 [Sesamum alatum]
MPVLTVVAPTAQISLNSLHHRVSHPVLAHLNRVPLLYLRSRVPDPHVVASLNVRSPLPQPHTAALWRRQSPPPYTPCHLLQQIVRPSTIFCNRCYCAFFRLQSMVDILDFLMAFGFSDFLT